MNLNSRGMKCATGWLSVLLTGFLLAGCSQTATPGPIQNGQAPSEQAAPPPMTSVQPTQAAAAGGQYEQPPVIKRCRPYARECAFGTGIFGSAASAD
jgi:hypothetical protein